MMDSLRQYWRSLSARERLMLSGGAALLALMLLYALVWQPVLDARNRLVKLLPRQQQNLQQVQQLVAQIQATRSGATGSRLEREAALKQAGELAGLSPVVQQIAAERILLRFDQVPFVQWLRFASSMQSSGWPVLAADIGREASGKVRVSAEFGR